MGPLSEPFRQPTLGGSWPPSSLKTNTKSRFPSRGLSEQRPWKTLETNSKKWSPKSNKNKQKGISTKSEFGPHSGPMTHPRPLTAGPRIDPQDKPQKVIIQDRSKSMGSGRTPRRGTFSHIQTKTTVNRNSKKSEDFVVGHIQEQETY